MKNDANKEEIDIGEASERSRIFTFSLFPCLCLCLYIYLHWSGKAEEK